MRERGGWREGQGKDRGRTVDWSVYVVVSTL